MVSTGLEKHAMAITLVAPQFESVKGKLEPNTAANIVWVIGQAFTELRRLYLEWEDTIGEFPPAPSESFHHLDGAAGSIGEFSPDENVKDSTARIGLANFGIEKVREGAVPVQSAQLGAAKNCVMPSGRYA